MPKEVVIGNKKYVILSKDKYESLIKKEENYEVYRTSHKVIRLVYVK